MSESVRCEYDVRGVARVTIDRPAKRNALSKAIMRDLIAAMQRVSERDDCRVVVLSGAGDKAFIGGADVAELAALDAQSAREFITLVHRACRAMIECPVPVIARIHGYALGAGLEVAAACDLRVASTTSQFAMPEVKLGLPSVVEAALLPRLIGAGRARWLVYTGDTIDAARALEWGLVENAVPAQALDDTIEQLVTTLLANGPQALRLQKKLCVAWDERPLAEVVDRSIDRLVQAFTTSEPRQMLGDLIAKRQRKASG